MRSLLTLAAASVVACTSSTPPDPVAPLTIAAPAAIDPCATEKATASASDTSADLETLAVCYDTNGRLIDALKSSQRALVRGIETREREAMAASRVHVKELVERMPHITFAADDVEGLAVVFDGRPVPADRLTKKFSVDVGEHVVSASGRRNGKTVKHEERIAVAERDFVTIQLKLE